jgi:DNA-binding XRE family transcriptional regulator
MLTSGLPIKKNPTLWGMRSKPERTEFGQRVVDARTHAKMTQQTLASAVGMSQGTLAETERIAMASTFTAQIAWCTGVNAYWLATGNGSMVSASPHVSEPVPRYGTVHPAQAINVLARALQAMPTPDRETAATLLAGLARNPEGQWSEWLAALVNKIGTPQTREGGNTDWMGKPDSKALPDKAKRMQDSSGPVVFGPALTKAFSYGTGKSERANITPAPAKKRGGAGS